MENRLLPSRPVVWYLIFSVVFFLINYFLTGSNYGWQGSAVYALGVGVLALLFLYLADKIRHRWFTGED